MSHLLSVLILLPLAGAAAVASLPRHRAQGVRWSASAVAIATCLLSTPLWTLYNPTNPDFQLVERLAWLPSAGASYALGIDGVSALMILLTTVVVAVVAVAWQSVEAERLRAYYSALLAFQAGLIGILAALDLSLFFVCWCLMLAGICWMTSAARVRWFALASGAAILAGILLLYVHHHAATGVYTFDLVTLETQSVPPDVQAPIFLALFVGFVISVAIFPFHAWLSSVQSSIPAGVSVVVLGLMLKAGTFGLLRVGLPLLPDATRRFGPAVAVLSMVSLAFAALVALRQRDAKRLLAYSSISQMGIVVLGLVAVNPVALAGSVLLQIDHGVAVAALLLLVGFASERPAVGVDATPARVQTIAMATVFVLLAVLSVGVPTVNGASGDLLVFQGVAVRSRVWSVVVAGGMVLGVAAMVRLYQQTASSRSAVGLRFSSLTLREWGTVAPLFALALWMTFYPAPFINRIHVPALKVAARLDPAYAGEFAAACDTTVTPEMKAASPANQFLAAAPCGPDGQPLAPAAATPSEPAGSVR